MRKKLLLLVLFVIVCTTTHAQYASWMKGIWKSSGGASIRINDVSRESFSGIKTIGSNLNIAIAGGFRGKGMYMQDGAIVNSDGKATAQQYDCAACSQDAKMIVSHDSLLLITSIADCDNKCNGQTIYYRLFSEYDDDAQHYLVDRFGRPADIIGFHPYQPKEGITVQSLDDDTEPAKTSIAAVTMTPDPDAVKQKAKNHQDSLDNIARIKQQKADAAALLAQQKKREKAITDSLNLVQQKDKQRLKDSLNNVARLEKIRLHTEDSLRNVQAKKRQQEVKDSINLAQQNKQQRIKDSLDNLARLRQQQISDSTQLAQQKKREKQIADSLNIAQQKEQQRLKDSLDNVARLEKIRLRTEDSLRDVQAKKRQQEVADSLNLANLKEQQRIKDSLQSVAAANLQKQRAEDSLREVQAKKRQQEVADSLNLANQKEQRIKDSLQSVAAANLQKQRSEDSLRDVQAKKRQQEISDSLASVRKQQYNDSLQKAALAKTVKPATNGNGSSAADKALTTRSSVLLQTYHISTPDILIELFDNGEIDGDRVSVYHNNAIIVSNQTLGLKPITLNVHADTANREHEFVLVAENLGSIPPNSALMRITAGKQSYKLSVNTDLKTNARIVFIYDGN